MASSLNVLIVPGEELREKPATVKARVFGDKGRGTAWVLSGTAAKGKKSKTKAAAGWMDAAVSEQGLDVIVSGCRSRERTLEKLQGAPSHIIDACADVLMVRPVWLGAPHNGKLPPCGEIVLEDRAGKRAKGKATSASSSPPSSSSSSSSSPSSSSSSSSSSAFVSFRNIFVNRMPGEKACAHAKSFADLVPESCTAAIFTSLFPERSAAWLRSELGPGTAARGGVDRVLLIADRIIPNGRTGTVLRHFDPVACPNWLVLEGNRVSGGLLHCSLMLFRTPSMLRFVCAGTNLEGQMELDR